MLVAIIREEACVGCRKCLDACPVDAIVGASKFMHTVLTEECIGCKLCVAPCPMDCIDMVDAGINDQPAVKIERAALAKKRYIARQHRLQQNQKPQLTFTSLDPAYKLKIRHEIDAAVSRVNARRSNECKTTT